MEAISKVRLSVVLGLLGFISLGSRAEAGVSVILIPVGVQDSLLYAWYDIADETNPLGADGTELRDLLNAEVAKGQQIQLRFESPNFDKVATLVMESAKPGPGLKGWIFVRHHLAAASKACASMGSSLPPQQRSNCYDDPKSYGEESGIFGLDGSDASKVISHSKKEIEYSFAQDFVNEALQLFNLEGQLATVAEGLYPTRYRLANLVLDYNQIAPTLDLPGFWEERGDPAPPLTNKLYRAGIFLVQKGFIFVDKNCAPFLGLGQISTVMDRKKFTKPTGCYRMGYDLDKELTTAMGAKGFQYVNENWQ